MPLFSADGCSDEVGFCALPAGIYLSPDGLIDFNSTAHFWSSSVKECSNNKECAYSIHIDSNGSFGVNGDMYSAQIGQASVRCAQDSCTDSRFTGKECDRCLDGVTDVMTDKNGTRYKTVCIDGRFWMAENMKYKTDTISCGGSNNESDYFDIYGCLYNGTNANNVCPTDNGWRLPTKQEVDKLFNYAQDNSNIHNAAYALKAKSETWSNAQNNEDTFGFAALPGGDIMQGSQSFVRERGFWWLSNNNYFSISSDNNVTSGSMQGAPGPNLSIRCIKDINE